LSHNPSEHLPTLGYQKIPPIINANRPTTADLLGLDQPPAELLIDVTEPPTNDLAVLAYPPQPPLIKLADPPPQYPWYFGKAVGDKFIAIDGISLKNLTAGGRCVGKARRF